MDLDHPGQDGCPAWGPPTNNWQFAISSPTCKLCGLGRKLVKQVIVPAWEWSQENLEDGKSSERTMDLGQSFSFPPHLRSYFHPATILNA